MKNRYIILLTSIFSDIVSAIFSLALAFFVVDKTIHFEIGINLYSFSYLIWVAALLFFFYIFNIYNILWRFSKINEFFRIVVASVAALAVFLVIQYAVYRVHFVASLYIMTFFFVNVLVIFARAVLKRFVNSYHDRKKMREVAKSEPENLLKGNIMLIGGGTAGEAIINEIQHNQEYSDCKIKCVIDDSPYKKNQYISGIRIVGGREHIIEAAKKFNISIIVFAITNCTSTQKSDILSICQKTGCQLKVIPSVCKMYNPDEISNTIRNVQIEDLLGREPIDVNLGDDLNYVENKVVLVTGGGGTIGSELCRQISLHNPKQLIIFDIYENNAYEIQNELKRNHPNVQVVTLIGSVRDSKRLDYLFRTYKPQIVYHAAAHKHVPLMEESPNETIKNNVFGTLKTSQCADKYGCEKFVLISTDKAVNPTNIMGASKRICEMIVQTFNKNSKTDFVAVRFGNVLGSNGSVIPLFKSQIREGGPVTVTDPNIIRYFMTIPEAVSLVLKAGANAKGGEIFVLDMGKPVKILTLAENLIRLSGFTPYKDIDIVFSGLRPGEKLYEELLMSEEGLTATEIDLIHIGKPIEIDEKLFFETIEEMHQGMYDETVNIRALVKKIVPTYKPENISK